MFSEQRGCIVLPYFPFDDDTFKMIMGVKALHDNSLIEIDSQAYREELALKHKLLSNEYNQYFQALPGTERLQWEVVASVLQSMVQRYPDYFELIIDDNEWLWRNRLLGEETCFTSGEDGSLPYAPLDWLGRQVQEDLLILDDATVDAIPLVAGQLCFPNGWCLDDKMGKSFLGIHEEVPLFSEHIGRSSHLLLKRLKAGRPVWRVNWSLKASTRLNLIPRYFSEEQQACQHVTEKNAGERCFLRIERQTLSRLPVTGGILFTIHTYQAPIVEIATSRGRARRIANVIQTLPDELLVYKNMASFVAPLLDYLENRAAQEGD